MVALKPFCAPFPPCEVRTELVYTSRSLDMQHLAKPWNERMDGAKLGVRAW